MGQKLVGQRTANGIMCKVKFLQDARAGPYRKGDVVLLPYSMMEGGYIHQDSHGKARYNWPMVEEVK